MTWRGRCVLAEMPANEAIACPFLDQGIGDIFSARVAGNIIDDHTLGSIEFATKVAGSKLVVVMGHTHQLRCQASGPGVYANSGATTADFLSYVSVDLSAREVRVCRLRVGGVEELGKLLIQGGVKSSNLPSL